MAYGADAVVLSTQQRPSGAASSELHYDSVTGLWGFMRQDGTYSLFAPGQPSYAGVSNPGTVVNSTTSGNVVDSRSIAAGLLTANLTLEATVRAFLSGTNGVKNLLVGIDADLSNALTATFAAGQVGIVTFNAQFLVKAASPHLLISRADFNAQYGFGLKRGAVTVNLASTAINLVTQAWVGNAGDSITIDSVQWTARGNGF